MAWFKGNLHCHTSRSDGKATPDTVGKFYRFIGHDFLGISDHNRYTPLEEWATGAGICGIPSCEYSGEICCHVVAVGVRENVGPDNDNKSKPREKVEILQDGIDRTNKAGGIPVLCHPGWHWTFGFDEISTLKNCRHFEVCNASPDCNSFPIPGFEPMDAIWDKLLTANFRYFGLANDDAHEYFSPQTTRSPHAALGYNVVKANSLTEKNVLAAIRNGHFYATTGIEVEDYKITENGIRISIKPFCDEKASFQFFGPGGVELQRNAGTTKAEYKFTGKESYLRIRIASTTGLWAWLQPVFMDELKSNIDWTAIN